MNMFVQTQPILNIEVSLASYYNSLSEYVHCNVQCNVQCNVNFIGLYNH